MQDELCFWRPRISATASAPWLVLEGLILTLVAPGVGYRGTRLSAPSGLRRGVPGYCAATAGFEAAAEGVGAVDAVMQGSTHRSCQAIIVSLGSVVVNAATQTAWRARSSSTTPGWLRQQPGTGRDRLGVRACRQERSVSPLQPLGELVEPLGVQFRVGEVSTVSPALEVLSPSRKAPHPGGRAS